MAKKKPFSYDKVREAARVAAKKRMVYKPIVSPQPPVNPADLLDTTRIEGKQLSTWLKEIAKYEEKCEKARKPGTLLVIDMTIFPAWVVWAIEQWKKLGSPTKNDKLVADIAALEDKAASLEKYAALDRKKGTEAGMSANMKGQGEKAKAKLLKTRDKKLEAASRKETEAKELRNQIQKLQTKLAE